VSYDDIATVEKEYKKKQTILLDGLFATFKKCHSAPFINNFFSFHSNNVRKSLAIKTVCCLLIFRFVRRLYFDGHSQIFLRLIRNIKNRLVLVLVSGFCICLS
jgi:hypothetical protein